MNGTAAMNKVLHTALQALFIIASACVLTALIIAGALNEAMRPWSGAFFLMLVPYYLILVKNAWTGNRRGKWRAPAHGAWPPRQACSCCSSGCSCC